MWKMNTNNLKDGYNCHCCTQKCKAYKRKVNSIMAEGLINLTRRYFRTKRSWVHIRDIHLSSGGVVSSNGGQFAGLKLWGLIEEKTNDDTKKRCSGYWRPTQKGMDFVGNRIMVEDFKWVFNNRVIETSNTNTTTIRKALGSKFNYEEMMRER